MSQAYLIADSGGTKTDWCFVDKAGKRTFFETEGYHPNHWNDEFIHRITKFWKKKSAYKDASLEMYCSGCFNRQKALELNAILTKIGFKNCTVSSDLEGAAKALLGNNSGRIAVQGTGSVCFNWDGELVSDVRGGKGHELGDEGSGFYFGKLIYERYLSKTLSNEQCLFFEEKIDVRVLNLKMERGQMKSALSEIAFLLKDQSYIFKEIHEENVHRFLKDVLDLNHANELSITGGYFYVNRAFLIPFYEENNVKVTHCIKKPIVPLVDYITALTD